MLQAEIQTYLFQFQDLRVLSAQTFLLKFPYLVLTVQPGQVPPDMHHSATL